MLLTLIQAQLRINLLHPRRLQRVFGIGETEVLFSAHKIRAQVADQRWLHDARLTTADGGALAKAMDYSLRRWSSLSRYAGTGNLPIDNNPVENIIGPVAIGKKN